ncbi:MAG TPA: MerR family transcriptional regulator [Aquihabitans sp.]|jgi:hypothetical protein|nr:MerR family transcriptional regulator [Aquihabitans sp.]
MDDPNELIDDAEAATILEVTPDRIQVMVDEDLLTPAGGEQAGRRFRRAEVEALRLAGG